MTVEQLIELLATEDPLDLVVVVLEPCSRGGPRNRNRRVLEGEPETVSSCSRKGRVYIHAFGHDC